MKPGGLYQPNECKTREKIAILIPYRNREKHLKILLNHLHPILQRQNLYYEIFVINQVIYFHIIYSYIMCRISFDKYTKMIFRIL